MKLARKGIIWLVALFALLLGGLTVLADDLDGSSGMDVVIVMDTSGSMQNSKGGGADPEGVAMEAAKLFVDMMESSGSRVGLVPFSDQLGNVVNLTDINSTADKEGVKSAISALSYGGDTDIGQAMQEGFSTASAAVREMGFGAGMGLPNMKKNVDELTIESKVGEGTVVRMLTYFSANDR